MTDIKLLPRPLYPPAQPELKRSQPRRWCKPTSSQELLATSQRSRPRIRHRNGSSEAAFRAVRPATRLDFQRSQPKPSCPVSTSAPLILQLDAGEQLQEIATQLQQWFQKEEGILYEKTDLLRVIQNWLNDSLEQLVSDAIEHCVSGAELYAFNRRGFKRALEKVQPRSDN